MEHFMPKFTITESNVYVDGGRLPWLIEKEGPQVELAEDWDDLWVVTIPFFTEDVTTTTEWQLEHDDRWDILEGQMEASFWHAEVQITDLLEGYEP